MYKNPPPPPYTLFNGGGQPYYPPNGPYYAPRRQKQPGDCGTSCCRCICCFCCFFVFLFVIQLLIFGFFYVMYDPKIPAYHIEKLEVQSFDLKPDSTLNTMIHLAIRAENPNKNVEFIYGNNNNLTVEYSDVMICAGKLPAFRQGHLNTTVLAANLTGNSTFGPNLQHDFAERQKRHSVPLMVKIKVPINIIFGDIIMRELMVYVNCSLIVEGLAPGNATKILSAQTIFAVEVS